MALRLNFMTIFSVSTVFSKRYENPSWKSITTRAQKKIKPEKAKNLNENENNTSVHEGTKCTPYELVFGKLAPEPSSELLSQQEKLETYDDYLINFVTQLHEMRTQARENLISAKEKSKIYYDKK